MSERARSRVTEKSSVGDQIVISAVDSITARKQIWEALISHSQHPRWYLDARMALETFVLYTVDMHEPQWYHKLISNENEADIPDLPCTSKATIYTASVAAGMIGSTVRKIITMDTNPHILSLDMFNNTLVVV
jgi:hypothetical protein